MAAGLTDRVDCIRLAEEAAVLERDYALAELPRLKDLLAGPAGVLTAQFAFARAPSGRAAVRVAIRAAPQLVCQRCLQGFEYPLVSSSDVEFCDSEAEAGSDSGEHFVAPGGMVSLCELAEEELLLALPIVAACAAPATCGRAPAEAASRTGAEDASRRPFANLRDLLSRT